MSNTISLVGNTDAQERRAKAQAAVDEFVKDKPSGPVTKSVWLGDGYIELAAFNNRVHLSAVYVVPEQRRRKLGSAYLKQLLDVVDKHGAEVQCRVEPFGPQSPQSKMGLRELAQWYKRHGFKTVPDRRHFLLRPAKPA